MTPLATLLAEIREALNDQSWRAGASAVDERAYGLLDRVVSALEHPTAEDVLALLRANPEAALAALGELRIAGAWTDRDGRIVRLGIREPEEVVRIAPSEMGVTPGRGFFEEGWRHFRDETGDVSDEYETREAAQAAADERLRAEGWVLVDNDRAEGRP